MSTRCYFGISSGKSLIYTCSRWASNPEEIFESFKNSIINNRSIVDKVLNIGQLVDPYEIVPDDILSKLRGRLQYIPFGVRDTIVLSTISGRALDWYTLLYTDLDSFNYLSQDLPWIPDGRLIQFGECAIIFNVEDSVIEYYQYAPDGRYIFGTEPMEIFKKEKILA